MRAVLGAVRIVALVAAACGLFNFFHVQAARVPFDELGRALGSGLLVALTLLFLVGAAGVGIEQPGIRDAWRSAWQRMPGLGLPLLPLALLQVVPSSSTFTAAVFAGALALYGVTSGRNAFRGWPAGPTLGDALRPWEVSVLGFCALVAILYVRIGSRAVGNFQNDSAYYFGVAKHIARTGRLEEPIVWHFLRKPPHVPTAPFDYWGGLTSMLLVPFLVVFGRTQHVANIIMAVLSAGGVAIFATLVVVYRVVRTRLLAGALVVGFALLPAVSTYRFDTESIPLYDFLLLVALLLAFQKRWAWSSVCAALLYQVRPDGAIIALFIWLWALWASRGAGLRRVALVQLAVLVATIALGAGALGVHAEAVRLKDQMDLYVWGARPHVDLLTGRLSPRNIDARVAEVVRTLLDIVPGSLALVGFAVVAGAAPLTRRARTTSVAYTMLWCLGLPCAVFVGVATGPMFVSMRTLHGLVPLVMLGSALAVESLVDRVQLWCGTRSWKQHSAAIVIVGVTVAAIVRPLSFYDDRAKARIGTAEQDLQSIDSQLGTAVVASNLPCYVIANTNASAISIPIDGSRAVEQAFDKYGVAWVIVVGGTRLLHSSAGLFARHARAWRIGHFQLEEVRHTPSLRLIRVTRRR